MRIIIAGGHGKIAMVLERLLSQRGDSVAGFIRNPAHVADLEQAGAEAVVVDLENASVDEVATLLQGADAVVFAAGAGPGSGAASSPSWSPSDFAADSSRREHRLEAIQRLADVALERAGHHHADRPEQCWTAEVHIEGKG